MNVKEFAALKVGDKIANDMSSSRGEVTEVNDQGVRVAWGPVPSDSGMTAVRVTFQYVVNSTSWFHWSKLEELPNQQWAGDEGSGP